MIFIQSIIANVRRGTYVTKSVGWGAMPSPLGATILALESRCSMPHGDVRLDFEGAGFAVHPHQT
jgi:hypothetical protein